MMSRRSEMIEPFLAVEMSERAEDLERAGVDVVHFELGEPDFEAPPVIRDAAEKALKDGRTKYTHSLGILPLREAISEHYRVTYGVDVSPDRVLVTPGTSPAMLLLFGHLLDAGDEVVLSDPYYACYPNFIRYAEGVPATVGITERERFQLRAEAIARRLGPRTKAILINSPSNPTGTVLAPEGLRAIAALVARGGPMIVSDEIYHGLSYEGRDRTILEFTDRAFVLNGFSKAYAMTGWRLGYLIAPADHVRALQKLFGNFFISTNEFVQWAGVAALREAGEDSRRFRTIFDERRRAMLTGLRALGFGVEHEPTGAFYVLADARRFAADSRQLALELLAHCHVAVTPGIAFGGNAEGYLRFSYAASLGRIQEGLRRLGRFLAGRR
ncbi:MAG: aspartate aminotransferase [Candidatus Rokubacteria bacterium 13_1_40CM_68_15]|nr:MAG: aspartate aminotransferase [Candidatus Rokubacteria bacterium 13_1_40CM_68_15]